ncbi:Uncharacterized protein PBTT_05859 [Plasmodiophora brassicae]
MMTAKTLQPATAHSPSLRLTASQDTDDADCSDFETVAATGTLAAADGDDFDTIRIAVAGPRVRGQWQMISATNEPVGTGSAPAPDPYRPVKGMAKPGARRRKNEAGGDVSTMTASSDADCSDVDANE